MYQILRYRKCSHKLLITERNIVRVTNVQVSFRLLRFSIRKRVIRDMRALYQIYRSITICPGPFIWFKVRLIAANAEFFKTFWELLPWIWMRRKRRLFILDFVRFLFFMINDLELQSTGRDENMNFRFRYSWAEIVETC